MSANILAKIYIYILPPPKDQYANVFQAEHVQVLLKTKQWKNIELVDGYADADITLSMPHANGR